MAEYRVGMTATQKFFTFVPLGILGVFAILVGMGQIPVKTRMATQGIDQVLVYTATAAGAASQCSAYPVMEQVGKDDELTFVPFEGAAVRYEIRFDPASGSPLKESPPYYSDQEYHVSKGPSATKYYYSLNNNNGCKSIQGIGIIVTH